MSNEMEIRMCNSKSGGLQCSRSHPLIHTLYYEEANAKIRELNAEITRLNALLHEQEVLEQKTMNHMLIEHQYGNVQITLRGKTKIFTPNAVLDLIRTLKRMYNHSRSYTAPAMIHCAFGDESKKNQV